MTPFFYSPGKEKYKRPTRNPLPGRLFFSRVSAGAARLYRPAVASNNGMAPAEAIPLDRADDTRRPGRLRLRLRRRLVQLDQPGGRAVFAFLMAVLGCLATAGTIGVIRAVGAAPGRRRRLTPGRKTRPRSR